MSAIEEYIKRTSDLGQLRGFHRCSYGESWINVQPEHEYWEGPSHIELHLDGSIATCAQTKRTDGRECPGDCGLSKLKLQIQMLKNQQLAPQS